MRCYPLTLIFLFLLATFALEAQTDVTIRRNEFKTGESGFEEAWKYVGEGDQYYAKRGIWYGKAFEVYSKALEYNISNPELNYKTGVSALFSDNKERAADFFLKSLELKNDVAEDILLLTGRSLQFIGRFSEAIEKFKVYLDSGMKKSDKNILLAKKYIRECNSAIFITSDTLRVNIVNAGTNINSNADDYSQLFSFDGKTMFFASRRKLPKSNDYYSDSKYDENIFISSLIDGSWGAASLAGEDINTGYCETPVYINSTGDSLYIYAGYENAGDIKLSVNKKGKWKTPRFIPFDINSKESETSFTLSPSGNEIYFVTDIEKDNIGGKDIYFIRMQDNRKWSKPKNAGPVINSVFDEESVRFSKAGDTLWFSSRGHNSIGGFDIFFSVRNRSGEWDSVKNYGYPVNTQWDEIFYYPSQNDDSSFYFASNRSGGFGGLDIYQGIILPPEPAGVTDPAFLPQPGTSATVCDSTIVSNTTLTRNKFDIGSLSGTGLPSR